MRLLKQAFLALSGWVIPRCPVQLFIALDNCLLPRDVLGEQNSVTCRLFPPQLTSPVGLECVREITIA